MCMGIYLNGGPFPNLDYLTDFNIWDKALTYYEKFSITTCKSFQQGKLLPWNIDDWTPINRESKMVKHKEVDHDQFCPKSLKYVFFHWTTNFDDQKEFCKKFWW